MITKEMVENVQTRAKFLSSEFYFLDEEDLCQDGMVLLLTLEKRNLPELAVFKAINNLFSKKMRDAGRRRKYETNIGSFPAGSIDAEDGTETTEEKIIREQFTTQLMDSLSGREKYIIDALVNKRSIDDIASELGTTRNNIRRLINKIVNRRKELEEE